MKNGSVLFFDLFLTKNFERIDFHWMWLRELSLFWLRVLSFPYTFSIYHLWILFSSNPTMVGEKWLILMKTFVISCCYLFIINLNTQSSHLSPTYFSYWPFMMISSLYLVISPCSVRLSTICIGLVELFCIRLTPIDFSSVLFTLREWDELYLALAFVRKSELLSYPTQQRSFPTPP